MISARPAAFNSRLGCARRPVGSGRSSGRRTSRQFSVAGRVVVTMPFGGSRWRGLNGLGSRKPSSSCEPFLRSGHGPRAGKTGRPHSRYVSPLSRHRQVPATWAWPRLHDRHDLSRLGKTTRAFTPEPVYQGVVESKLCQSPSSMRSRRQCGRALQLTGKPLRSPSQALTWGFLTRRARCKTPDGGTRPWPRSHHRRYGDSPRGLQPVGSLASAIVRPRWADRRRYSEWVRTIACSHGFCDLGCPWDDRACRPLAPRSAEACEAQVAVGAH